MDESEIIAFAREFEMGGDTLNHVTLERLPLPEAVAEIRGCFDWLKGLLGKDPVSFCPPFGAYGERSITAIYLAGFRTIRTTELLSTKVAGSLLHTTLQAFPHSGLTYFKHLLLRRLVIRLDA